MGKLSGQKCVPCSGEKAPLLSEDANALLLELNECWSVEKGKLSCSMSFRDFKSAWKYAEKIADIAEIEGHHPDLYISYGKLKVELFTHAINGLSKNDFIIASKIDELSK